MYVLARKKHVFIIMSFYGIRQPLYYGICGCQRHNPVYITIEYVFQCRSEYTNSVIFYFVCNKQPKFLFKIAFRFPPIAIDVYQYETRKCP